MSTRSVYLLTWLLPLALFVGMVVLIDTVRARGVQRSGLPDVRRVSRDAPFPLEVIRAGDEEVLDRIEARPTRVLLGNATLVDLAVDLIEPERVIALADQARTWSRLTEPSARYAAFLAVPTLRKLGAEQILALQPDLVLHSPFNASLSGAWSRAAGIPMISVPHPESVEELRSITRLLGRVLGVEDRAASVVAQLDARIQALLESSSRRRGLRAIAYSNFGGGGWCSGSATLADEMIRMTGMRNVAAEFGRIRSTKFTFEDMHAAAPDVIIVSAPFGEQDGASYRVVTTSTELAEVPAVKHGWIVPLHPRLFATGSQEIVTAAERVAAVVDELLEEATGR